MYIPYNVVQCCISGTRDPVYLDIFVFIFGFIEFGSGSSILADYRSESRVLMTKNCKKIYSWHKGRPGYRESLQPSKESIHHSKA
jgi:hypothetical protein